MKNINYPRKRTLKLIGLISIIFISLTINSKLQKKSICPPPLFFPLHAELDQTVKL